MPRNPTDSSGRGQLGRHSLLTVVCLALLSLSLPLAAQEQPYAWEGELRPGATLAVHTVHGAITVTRAAGTIARFKGTRRGDRHAAADIRFEANSTGDTVRVCALYAQASSCDAGGLHSERWRNGRGDEGADLEIELPAGVHLFATSGSGDVSITGADADVHARSGLGDVRVGRGARLVIAGTGNGDVSVEEAGASVRARSGNGRIDVATRAGPVQARTGNGDIVVSMESLQRPVDMEFRTANGSITVDLPSDFGGRLSARTGHGEIESDFPVNVLAGPLRRGRLEGVIGDGGPRIELSTTNGLIRLRRARLP